MNNLSKDQFKTIDEMAKVLAEKITANHPDYSFWDKQVLLDNVTAVQSLLLDEIKDMKFDYNTSCRYLLNQILTQIPMA